MHIPIELEPPPSTLPAVEYRWDADTDILSAQLTPRPGTGASTGSLEVEGRDGSWLILEVSAERLNGVEVAVWPDVRKRGGLAPPAADPAAIRLRPSGRGGLAGTEMDTAIVAEADDAERIIHFRLGTARAARTVRLGADLLLDLDVQSRLAGVWMLNVPPFPDES